MKKLITIMLTLILIVSLAARASAITSGKWDFAAGQQSAQSAAAAMIEGRSITYDYNGGLIVQRDGWRWEVTTSAEYESHGTHTIPEETPWRFGYEFVGWMHSGTGVIYQPGDLIQGLGDVTLVAQWEEAPWSR